MDDLNVILGVVAAIGLCCFAVLACEVLVKRPRSFKEAVTSLRQSTARPAAAPLANKKKRPSLRTAVHASRQVA
jgi:hypothetical protein